MTHHGASIAPPLPSLLISSLPRFCFLFQCLSATICLTLGKWIQESNAKESRDVINLYNKAIHFQPKWSHDKYKTPSDDTDRFTFGSLVVDR